MNIDVHAHYVPPDSLKWPARSARAKGLKMEKNERGRDVVTRDGQAVLTQLKAEFSDLDLRLSIMDQQGVDMQVMSPASSYFFYWMPAEDSLEFARWLNDSLGRSRRQASQAFGRAGVGTDARQRQSGRPNSNGR